MGRTCAREREREREREGGGTGNNAKCEMRFSHR